MVHTCVDLVLEDLENLEKGLFFGQGDLVQKLKVELRFLRTFLWCSSGWRNYSDGPDGGGHLRTHLLNIENILKKAGEDLSFARDRAISGNLNEELDRVVVDFLERVEAFKVEIREDYLVWAKYSLDPNSSLTMSAEVLVEFVNCVLLSLKDLLKCEDNLIVSLKEQILALEAKLKLLRNFVILTNRQDSGYRKIGLFFTSVEDAANKAAVFTYLCCLQRRAESEGEVNDMLSDLLVKIKPSTSEIIEMHVGILKASNISRPNIYVVGEVVVNFVSFLLAMLLPAKHQVEQLREGLILMMAFLIDPPEKYKFEGKQISGQPEDVMSEVASLFYSAKTKDQIPVEKDHLLSDILEKLAGFRMKVGEIFPELFEPPSSFYPRVDNLGILDSFMRNLKELLKSSSYSVSFLKHQFKIILSDLESLRSFLMDTVEQKNELEELIYLWSCVAYVTNEVEYLIDSFLVGDYPVWYYKLRLSVAVDMIKRIQTEARAFCEQNNHNLSIQKSITSDLLLLEVNSPKLDSTMVGFLDEAETLRVKLTRGGMQLDIVAIVGMAGLGKTTLARKLYHEGSVTRHFHVRAWCCVSQVYQKRALLLTILNQIIELTDRIRGMNTKDLEEVLYKSLKRERYLIVMDDMWSTGAWNDLKNSFPDDNNGSRILLTTRLHEVALQAKPDCNPHALRFFSSEESWELLEKRVFMQQKCPNELSELGRQIATGCKGLPLSVVLVAGLLARTQKKKDWWMHVVERLSSKLVDEMEQSVGILDLSYKHLPDNLKPCFLYFGAFPQDEEVAVTKLIRLWSADGLVCKNDVKTLEDVGEDYLMDLINRSLVIVSKKTSKGCGVKTCHVHDLLHDFCVAKAKEECFLKHVYDDDVRLPDLSDLICQFEGHVAPDTVTYDIRRLSVFSAWERFRNCMPSGPRVRSLMFFSANVTSPFKYQSSFGSHIAGIIHNFKHLKVLDLGRINVGDSFPNQVQKLVLLRYLALQGGINSIPASIATLWRLETLIVKGLKGEVTLPDTIWEMANLRHLHINNRVVFSLDDSQPGDTTQSNLETCSTLSLSYGICAEKIIRRLVNIRKLKSIFFESWDDLVSCNRFPVIDYLSQLESLKLMYHGSILFPCEISLPSSLRKLTLSQFRLPWDAMSIIVKLPNLEVLKLLHRAFEGEQWDMGDAEFLKLKFLKLDTLKLVQWIASSDNFPCLQQLVLQKCKQLEEIPSSFGDIPTLEKIEVQWCSISASNSAREIEEEQPDIKVLIHPPDVNSSSNRA